MGKRCLALVIIFVGVLLPSTLAAQNPVTVAKVGSVTVTTTIPVSGTITVPLPSGAATATLQGVTDTDDASIATGQTAAVGLSLNMAYDGSVWRRLTFGTAGTASAQVLTVQGIASMTPFLVAQATAANLNATVVGTGTFVVQAAQSGTWNITNVSGTVSLPTGAATAAKQPALGTAGSPASDVLSVQGINGGIGFPVLGTVLDVTALQTSATANGNGTALDVSAYSSVWLVINCATCSGGTTINFEGGDYLGDYGAIVGYQTTTATPTWAASTTTAGFTYWRIPTAGVSQIRARISGYSAGTVTVYAQRSVFAAPLSPLDVVNTAQINGVAPLMGNGVTGTGSQRVTIASDNTAFAVNGTLQTQTDTVMVGGVNIKEINAVTPLMGNGATGTGALRVSIANDSTGVVQPGNTANTTPWLVSNAANTGSGIAASGCYLVSAASTNATSCKGSAGNFYGVRAINTTATLYYLRMYNTASAPTCSSATGFIESIPVPASATGSGFNFLFDIPIQYATGIGFCFTGGSSSTDNSNAATGVFAAIYYK